MSFFRDMPSITYRGRAAPNIISRIALPQSMLRSGELYHPYVIEDGDRPEVIADLYYNDVSLDWLVRLANNIYDEASQWPLTQNQLERHLKVKYPSVEYTLSTIDHYKLKSSVPNIDSAAYGALTLSAKKYWYKSDTNNGYIFIKKDWDVTPETWNGFVGGERDYWSPVSIYDKEFDANEQKRFIRLIDRAYAPLYVKALKEISLDNDR